MAGLVWGLVSNNWSQFTEAGLFTFPEGILGGSLFAIANLLIPTVVNNLGLGVGFMLWNATNITMGYLISRLGLFGVTPTVPDKPWLSVLGILFMLASIGVYGMIKPTLAEPKHTRRYTSSPEEVRDEKLPLLSPDRREGSSSSLYKSTLAKVLVHRDSSADSSPGDNHAIKKADHRLLQPELPNFGPFMMSADLSEHVAFKDQAAEQRRKLVGVVIALLVGCFLSCCLVPYVHWQQACRPTSETEVIATCNPLNFIFSQCLGIYVTSTAAFLLYSVLHKYVLRRSMPRSVMRPAYLCGVLWAVGLGGQLYSAGKLGFDQAYPLSSIGPAMVSMLWSACYFKEIQGPRNLRILALATFMVFIGTGLRVASM